MLADLIILGLSKFFSNPFFLGDPISTRLPLIRIFLGRALQTLGSLMIFAFLVIVILLLVLAEYTPGGIPLNSDSASIVGSLLFLLVVLAVAGGAIAVVGIALAPREGPFDIPVIEWVRRVRRITSTERPPVSS
jgi:hypothetical protein